ncbi:Oidioi.mRNA.OKI2018_I69.PAR.g12297.t1.cds [Oikopleura dioica]|uniref:S-formylglutathione hydrolase n=1 Tax=Oikopleura dioica TaxID=34765 RepID=A0ABN7S521_OIKDI|nr:Oidioi.mRNA.OKI2018_I69.PAR.g12297.t1.cds [Oikopleura dioica]
MAQEVSSNKSFGGVQKVYSHESKVLGCSMKFAVYTPPGDGPFPVLWFLSGLTCTEANCVQKGSFQQSAAAQGIVVICPDTSPRGIDIEGDNDSWDFGTGAGFYVNATEEKWKPYRMYEYVTEELPSVCAALLGDKANMAKQSITGHSMGGHGALICAMKNPSKYQSVSAFSPICAPMNCPWGQKAFSGYLGEDKSTWEAYDASKLAEKYSGPKLKVLIDQGSVDDFLIKGQLLPEQFVAAALKNDQLEVEYRLQEGYDHSYFFISSFMKDHIEFHAKFF